MPINQQMTPKVPNVTQSQLKPTDGVATGVAAAEPAATIRIKPKLDSTSTEVKGRANDNKPGDRGISKSANPVANNQGSKTEEGKDARPEAASKEVAAARE